MKKNQKKEREKKRAHRFQLLEINNKVPLIHHKTSASTHFSFRKFIPAQCAQASTRRMIGIFGIYRWMKSSNSSNKKNSRNSTFQKPKINPNHTHIQLTFVYFVCVCALLFTSSSFFLAVSLIFVLVLSLFLCEMFFPPLKWYWCIDAYTRML